MIKKTTFEPGMTDTFSTGDAFLICHSNNESGAFSFPQSGLHK